MTPGQAAIADQALHLSSTVTGWAEYGTATFTDSWVIACDASSISHLGATGPVEYLPVSGAAVDEAGFWWAWRATVPSRYCGLVVHWAECLTLLLVLRGVRPDALVLSDHAAAIRRAQNALSGRQQRRLRSWRKVEAAFGSLPVVPPSAAARVQYYGGHELHRRAHRISNAVRRLTGPAWWPLEVRCSALAAGWNGEGSPSKYLSGITPDLPAPAGGGPALAISPRAGA